MRKTKSFLATLVLTAFAAAAIGFGASHLLDTRAVNTLKAERDAARDCRHAGTTVAPCPVVYRNTRIVWRDRIQTIEAPERKQAERIARLSAQLAHARLAIHNLQVMHIQGTRRATGTYVVQNGSMAHPYNTYDRCPPGSVAVYDAGLASGNIAIRRSGDPGVCYVRNSLHRVALLSKRR